MIPPIRLLNEQPSHCHVQQEYLVSVEDPVLEGKYHRFKVRLMNGECVDIAPAFPDTAFVAISITTHDLEISHRLRKHVNTIIKRHANDRQATRKNKAKNWIQTLIAKLTNSRSKQSLLARVG